MSFRKYPDEVTSPNSKIPSTCFSFFRAKNIPESTLRFIIKNKEQYKVQSIYTSMYNAKMPTRTRSYAMETMERMLAIWIEECNQNDTNVTLNDIKKRQCCQLTRFLQKLSTYVVCNLADMPK